ncbi:hypothetical protein VE00_08285 [Pseudogymnoascus sp. WSF 3629]|nr:hypothetical protein VE00_08285 [Pseudogymnoascus sp. WSF 3629]
MRTSFIALVGLVTSILAVPNSLQPRQDSICAPPGHEVCCNPPSADIVDFGCTSPFPPPVNVTDFQNICSSKGSVARCCDLVIFNIGILCSAP